MGFFYFDESIHERAGFIVGAYVYSPMDLTPLVFGQLRAAGYKPGVDEFKSSSKMYGNLAQQELRDNLREIVHHTKIGLCIVPSSCRETLGIEALHGLKKILDANDLTGQKHEVFFDQGIAVMEFLKVIEKLELHLSISLHLNQDSRLIGGLQLADLVAHTMGIMLLEQLGLVTKMVKANDSFEPDEEYSIGFEMWASLRYYFFTKDNIKVSDNQLEGWTLNTGSYALWIAGTCDEKLRNAADLRFGTCYMGCVH